MVLVFLFHRGLNGVWPNLVWTNTNIVPYFAENPQIFRERVSADWSIFMELMLNTKMKIAASAERAFEAYVDPEAIGGFWFSRSSERWQAGKTVIVRYDEFDFEGPITVTRVEPGRRIEMTWGEPGELYDVVFAFDPVPGGCVVEITETGWRADDPELITKMVNNKGGWVYSLTCLKALLENGITTLRTGMLM